MGKPIQAGKLGTRGRLACNACAALALAASLLATGCSNTQKQHVGDPLVGEFMPTGPTGQPMAPPPAKQTTSGPKTQPTPTTSPFSSGSPAAMANNTSLPGGKALAITQPNWTLMNNQKTGGPTAGPTVVPLPRDDGSKGVVPASGVTISLPSAMPQGFGNAAPLTNPNAGVPSVGTPNASVQTAADLEKALKDRGAMNLRHGPVPGGVPSGAVQASCLVPHFSNPANLRYFEATAADLPAALRSLLEQVQKS